jgi:hypothetical protein
VVPNETVNTKVAEKPTVDERILMIDLMRKHGILDLCKNGLKTLFTYEELYEMAIK